MNKSYFNFSISLTAPWETNAGCASAAVTENPLSLPNLEYTFVHSILSLKS